MPKFPAFLSFRRQLMDFENGDRARICVYFIHLTGIKYVIINK